MKTILYHIAAMALFVSSSAIQADNPDSKHDLILKTQDGKQIRAKVHPDDHHHISKAKKGDKLELYTVYPNSLGLFSY